MTSQDIKDKYLEKLGLAKAQNGSILDPKICPSCRHPNLFNASICENCKYLLNVNIGIEKDGRMVAIRKFLLALSQDTYIKFRIGQMAQEKQELVGILETIASDGSNGPFEQHVRILRVIRLTGLCFELRMQGDA